MYIFGSNKVIYKIRERKKNMEKRMEILKKSKIFKDFTEKEIQAVLNETDWNIKEYKAKQIIEIVPDRMIFLIQGVLHTIENSDSGSKRIVNICTPNTSSFIPMIAKKEYSSVSIVVKKDAVILLLPTTVFENLNTKIMLLQNKLQKNLIRSYNELLQENLTRAMVTSETTARKRILKYFQLHNNGLINNLSYTEVTMDELADILNVDLSTLMRELRILKGELGVDRNKELINKILDNVDKISE